MALKKYTFHIGILTYSRFLNQRKRENDRRNISWRISTKECRTGRGSNRVLLITSWTRIRPSHQRRSLNPDTILSTHNSVLMLVLQSIHLHLLPTLLFASICTCFLCLLTSLALFVFLLLFFFFVFLFVCCLFVCLFLFVFVFVFFVCFFCFFFLFCFVCFFVVVVVLVVVVQQTFGPRIQPEDQFNLDWLQSPVT